MDVIDPKNHTVITGEGLERTGGPCPIHPTTFEQALAVVVLALFIFAALWAANAAMGAPV